MTRRKKNRVPNPITVSQEAGITESKNMSTENKETTPIEPVTEVSDALVDSTEISPAIAEEPAAPVSEIPELSTLPPAENIAHESVDTQRLTTTPDLPPTPAKVVELSPIIPIVASIEQQLKTRIAFYAAHPVLSKTQVKDLCVDLANIAIEVHDSGNAKALDLYLDYVTKYPSQIQNILVAMDTVLKNSSRHRNSVAMMQSAFGILAMAIRNKKAFAMNLNPLQTDIINKGVLNYITSKLG